ncbi:MAG: cytochrome c3 family protein [Thermoanaerobaculia bacterium]
MRHILITILSISLASAAFGQMTKEECLGCHSDPSLVQENPNGSSRSVHVDPAKFDASVHGSLDCTDCHASIKDYPHESVTRVDCGSCHSDEAEATNKGIHSTKIGGRTAATCYDCHGNHAIRPPSEKGALGCPKCHQSQNEKWQRSVHGRAAAKGDSLAPQCSFCHGGHEIRPHTDPKAKTAVMNIPLLCGSCHREGSKVSLYRNIPEQHILENYVDSIHGEGLFRKGLTVTAVCTSCHRAHDILPPSDPHSTIAKANVVATCKQCHAEIEQVHRKVINGKLWETEPHRIPVCVDCHAPHKARRVFYDAGMANLDCLRCHGKRDLTMTRDGKKISIYVDTDAYASSMHAKTACAQCHTDVSPSHERPCETVKKKVDCSICHAEVVASYQTSIHGQLAAKNDKDAPRCLDCHSPHATQGHTIPTSNTYPRNIPELCARCHRAGQKAAVRIHSKVKDIVQTYEDSIHGKALTESGLVVTATCINCHSSHGELPPSDVRSTVNPKNISKTCGTCHNGIEAAFEMSIHATGKPKDGMKLPTCNDCHTAHGIGRVDKPGFRTKMMMECGGCHKKEAATFFDTFHGKVSRLGSEGAAKCYDCHGTHNILPPDDPRSTLARNNVVQTCAKCHPGSHRRFAGYLTHSTHHDPKKFPWLFWSFRFMVTLLIGTLSFFLVHTLAWLLRLWRTREHWGVHKDAAKAGGQKFYKRFSRFQRSLHLVMLLSFFTLATTGMALKFSYTGWAQVVSWFFGGAQSMGYVHRVGAIVLISVFATHIYELIKRKRAEKRTWLSLLTGPDTMMFTLRDLREIGQSFRWFVGKGDRPKYGRFTYWEKFDYFAVFWGVMVIGISGLILWFPVFMTHFIPGWAVNVATIIHSDEALLAVAFIFTIHFFNTHFRPDKFPMDPVIFTGRVPVDELQYDKPGEYADLVEAGTLEEHLVGPISKPLERMVRIFGFTALGIGLVLIGLIVYAMIFAYR